MQVIFFYEFDGLFHVVRIIEDEAEHGGGGDVGLIGLDVGGNGLLALVAHEDAAADARVVHAVEGRKGSGEAGYPVHQPFHVLLSVDTQKLQIDGGDGGVSAVAGIGIDDAGIGLGEVVISSEHSVAVLGLRREGGAGDVRGGQSHIDEPFGDVVGDEGDELAVALHAALFDEFVEIEPAFHGHGIDRAVLMRVVAHAYLFHADGGGDLVAPHARDGNGERTDEDDDHGQYDRQDLQPQFSVALGFGCSHCLLSNSSFFISERMSPSVILAERRKKARESSVPISRHILSARASERR